MKLTLVGSTFILLLIAPHVTAGQQVPAVRVCVVAEQTINGASLPDSTSNARWQRDLLVNYLNQQKPGKNSQVKLEAVPLTTIYYNGIAAEARAKGCEYIVQADISFLPLNSRDASEWALGFNSSDNPRVLANVGYSVRKVSGDVVPPCPGYALASPSGAAMSIMSDVYQTIIKAVTP